MKISFAEPALPAKGAVVVLVEAGKKLSPAAKELDKLTKGAVKRAIGASRFEGKKGRWGILGTFVVGIAFAFGWTPCIGPFLAGLLFLASNQDTVWQGFFLLLVYSFGLAVPFLLAAIAVNAFLSAFQKVKKHFRIIEVVGGILLIEFGHIILFNKLGWLAGKLGFVDLGF